MISNKRYSEQGFTLLEMAIVMLIIGIVSSGFLIGVPQYMEQKKWETTQAKFDLIENALSVYAQRHYRLPCPADSLDIAGVDRGGERNNGNCLDVTSEESLFTATQGVVPWRELGLSETDVMDGWGRYVTYKPAPHLTVDTYAAEMQNDPVDGQEIHNACRTQDWFDDTGNHLNRQKALFCCNAAPKTAYLGGAAMPANWRNNAVMTAGIDTDDDPTNDNVASTIRWVDDYGRGGGVVSGTFNDVYDDDADAPLLRASGQAVTLISHGGNGVFSHLRKQASVNLIDATYTPGSAPTTTAQQNATQDERKNIWPPQAFSGIMGHPKAAGTAHNKGFGFAGASDDAVTFLRTDQLFAKAGSATCVRPAYIPEDVCVNNNKPYGDFTYVMDTSGSMNSNFGGKSRSEAAKDALRTVVPAHIASEADNDEDPDIIGMTGLTYTEITPAGTFINYDPATDTKKDLSDPTVAADTETEAMTRIDNFGTGGGTPLLHTTIQAAMMLGTRNPYAGPPLGSSGVIQPDGTQMEDPNDTEERIALMMLSDGYDNGYGNKKWTYNFIEDNYTDLDLGDPDIQAARNDNSVNKYELTALILKKNFPNLVINIIDVANNPDLGDISDTTGGEYIQANNQCELNNYLASLVGVCGGTNVASCGP